MAQVTYESVRKSIKGLEALFAELKDIHQEVQELKTGMTSRKRRPSPTVKKEEVDPLTAAAEACINDAYDRDAGNGEIELPGPTFGWW